MFNNINLEPIFIIGIMIILAFYTGKSMKWIKLPTIIGFMIIGAILGPSVFNIIDDEFQHKLTFITDIALGFVALGIGLELSFKSLKKQGAGIIIVIFAESFAAFFVVTGLIYAFTKDLPLALIFGSIAPASDPAGTVAIIQEYKSKGPLTNALYSVVGFDDALGIIIFGFAAAFAKSLLGQEMGIDTGSILQLISTPLIEVGLSLVVGCVVSFLFSILSRKLSKNRDLFILLFGFILISSGLCKILNLSVILTNMVFGIVIVNTQKFTLIEKLHDELKKLMPLLFILFFTLAGANLHINAIPSLGLIGLLYFISRGTGLIGGAKIGSYLGRLPKNIKKYLGLGILSQAGVAISLGLVVKSDFAEFGAHGMQIGYTVITTVTVTSILFTIIGPILTKVALSKSGEIKNI